MPGDGVGNDLTEATRIVLDRLKLDAEYVPCDTGWAIDIDRWELSADGKTLTNSII